MAERILCVDDDPNILEAYRRHLCRQFQIELALGGEEALAMVVDRGPFAVVVADMRMPGMDGIQLLMKIKEFDPDTVRMMLTGKADLQTALDAVNDGHIFSLLTKPCPPLVFAKALEAGIAQYRLIIAEHELLSSTLHGSVKVLTDVLGLVNPAAFGRASRVHRMVTQICGELGLDKTWPIEMAAMLCQIGCVAVPEETLAKSQQERELSPSESEAIRNHPELGRRLIANVPRLEEIAQIIAYQEKRYHGDGFPEDDVRGNEIPLGSRMLKVALDFDDLVSTGMSRELALAKISDRQGWYDPAMISALRQVLDVSGAYVVRPVDVAELADGAILADDVKSVGGMLLCNSGQEVTSSMRARLENYASNVGLILPIKIFVASNATRPEQIVDPCMANDPKDQSAGREPDSPA